jgi:predicted DNA-binding transcriptional regulator AlpA
MKQLPADLFSAAIEAAVERALERRLPVLLEKHLPTGSPTLIERPVPKSAGERFITLREAGLRLGAHRTTILRWEAGGLVPPRRRLPGHRTGWLASEFDKILLGLSTARVSK